MTYTLGAGLVGCLYDYGPHEYESESDALEDAEQYLDSCNNEGDSEDCVSAEDMANIMSNLKSDGIHYFSNIEKRILCCGDYIEITNSEV